MAVTNSIHDIETLSVAGNDYVLPTAGEGGISIATTIFGIRDSNLTVPITIPSSVIQNGISFVWSINYTVYQPYSFAAKYYNASNEEVTFTQLPDSYIKGGTSTDLRTGPVMVRVPKSCFSGVDFDGPGSYGMSSGVVKFKFSVANSSMFFSDAEQYQVSSTGPSTPVAGVNNWFTNFRAY